MTISVRWTIIDHGLLANDAITENEYNTTFGVDMFGERQIQLPISLLEHMFPGQTGWTDLAFGIFGGIDIGHQCTASRSLPLRLTVDTERASLRQFCTDLQTSLLVLDGNNVSTVREHLILAMNSFPKTAFLVNDDLFVCLDSKAKEVSSLSADSSPRPIHLVVQPQKSVQIIGLGESFPVSKPELILLALASSIAHYQNRTGVELQVQRWCNRLRRPSVRKSWPRLLQNKDNYFWLAVQLYRQILSNGDVAYRERYITFLRTAAEELNQPELSRIALQFRSSAEQWRRLAVALIIDGSSSLITAQQAVDLDPLLRSFVAENHELDIALRLDLIEKTIRRILSIEKEAFSAIREVIAPLSLSIAS